MIKLASNDAPTWQRLVVTQEKLLRASMVRFGGEGLAGVAAREDGDCGWFLDTRPTGAFRLWWQRPGDRGGSTSYYGFS